MPLYQKLLIGCVGLIVLGFLMVGAMVLFGLAISQPGQRRLTNPPATKTESDRPAPPYSNR